jgi:peptidoglycan/LPS O-acetylase OafA/YrhL
MWVLLLAAAALVLACHHLCKPGHAPKGLGWLATMGRLSYEIYLSHMFVVLTAVLWFRQAFAPDLRWGFLVYPVCIAACVALGAALQRWVTLPCERWLRARAPARQSSTG